MVVTCLDLALPWGKGLARRAGLLTWLSDQRTRILLWLDVCHVSQPLTQARYPWKHVVCCYVSSYVCVAKVSRQVLGNDWHDRRLTGIWEMLLTVGSYVGVATSHCQSSRGTGVASPKQGYLVFGNGLTPVHKPQPNSYILGNCCFSSSLPVGVTLEFCIRMLFH